MSSIGITGLIVETHNWGRSVSFWRDLGYALVEPEQLRHPAGGPFSFLVERPEGQKLEVVPMLAIEDATTFTPPAAGAIQRGFEPQHWGVSEMGLLDPDRRPLSVQGPLPAGVARRPQATASRVSRIHQPPHCMRRPRATRPVSATRSRGSELSAPDGSTRSRSCERRSERRILPRG